MQIEYFPRKYNTIAHRFLDLEIGFGTEESDYKTIDTVIDVATDNIPTLQDYKREEAEEVMCQMDTIFKRFKFRVRRTNSIDHNQLNKSCKNKIFNCKNRTVLALSIAEKLRFPLFAVPTLSHFFLRWQGSEYNLNWESFESLKKQILFIWNGEVE